jgi:hypothetical protein
MASPPRVEVSITCPVCGLSAVDRVFRDFSFTVKKPLGGEKPVNAIAAYICMVNGHVFFVRISDLNKH